MSYTVVHLGISALLGEDPFRIPFAYRQPQVKARLALYLSIMHRVRPLDKNLVIVLPSSHRFGAYSKAKRVGDELRDITTRGLGIINTAISEISTTSNVATVGHISSYGVSGTCQLIQAASAAGQTSLIVSHPDAEGEFEATDRLCLRLAAALKATECFTLKEDPALNETMGRLERTHGNAEVNIEAYRDYQFYTAQANAFARLNCAFGIIPLQTSPLLAQAIKSGVSALPAANRMVYEVTASSRCA